MNIITRNGVRGRSIHRVTNHPAGFGYVNWGNRPSLSFSATGQDGIRYTIELDADDLTRLVEAQARYAEHFMGGKK